MPTASKVFNSILARVAPRQKEVIVRRFGLDKSAGDEETLAAIGDRLGITRERVRQIEKSALGLASKEIAKNPACMELVSKVQKHLKGAGGVLKKETLLSRGSDFMKDLNENHLALLLEASGSFHLYPEDNDFWPFYYLSKNDLKAATNFVEEWINHLREYKPKVLASVYKEYSANFIKAKRMDKNVADNYLSISKNIHSNPYGEVGLREWPEIHPTTTRDRIYLVLKKMAEPLHFETIADLINKTGFGPRVALAPTIHNELIKDDRFVLVGRGTYALKEHGYEPGVAREIIQKVLKRHGPLKPKEVVAHVKKQRLFKPNTIVINLQNRNFFERLADGRYRIRES